MSTVTFGPPAARPTRFTGLGYRQDAPGLWRFVDTSWTPADGMQCTIGPQYRTKAELLADAARFAAERGYGEE